jgi:hypothetical protein
MFKKVTGRPASALWAQFALFHHKPQNVDTIFVMKSAKIETGQTRACWNSIDADLDVAVLV